MVRYAGLLAGLWLIASPASALEYWEVAYESRPVAAESALTAAERLSQIVRAPVASRLVPFTDVAAILARHPEAPVIAEFPPIFFHALVDAGWRPIMRYRANFSIQIFRDVGTDIAHDGLMFTPPRSTTAAAMAPAVLNQSVLGLARLQAAVSHTACIRGVVAGYAQGCVTAPFFVNAYADRFGIALEAVGPSLQTPPPVLFVTQAVSETQIVQIQANLTESKVAGFPLRPFIEMDFAAYESMGELAADSGTF
ncbi:hypothetical protein [Litorivicinus lipolyticus]|uniref:hypothetical protein n=1 Tax=Litorivicinus lipolyticus TaxID=418701 RepID=UPI003B5929FF